MGFTETPLQWFPEAEKRKQGRVSARAKEPST